MKNAESRVTLDLTDSPELQEYLKNKQPGDDYSIHIKGKVVDNTPEVFSGDVSSVVEDSDTAPEPDDDTPDVEATPEMDSVIAGAVGKKPKGKA